MKRSLLLTVLVLALAAASSLMGPAQPAIAATVVWIGLNGSTMTDPANWVDGVAPVEGDALVFPSDVAVTLINDYPGSTRFASLSFPYVGSGSFTQMGYSAVALDDGMSIDGYAGNQLLMMSPVVFEGSQSVATTGTEASIYGALAISELPPFGPPILTMSARSGGRLLVPATITGAGGLRVLTDADAAVLVGGAKGSWEGTTTVGDGAEPGVLTIAGSSALSTTPPVVIAAGSALVADYHDAGVVDTWPNEIIGGAGSGLNVKTGSALHLTHDNSTSFMGTASVTGGSLELAAGAALGGSVQGSYGTLSGAGEFPDVSMTNSSLYPGTYSPSALAPTQASIGTMTVDGDVAMSGTQGRIQVKVANAGSPVTGAGARVDAVEVAGSAGFDASSSQLVLKTLTDGTGLQSFGLASGFDPTKSYRWPVVHASGGIRCPGAFTVDLAGWSNARNGGAFAAELSPDTTTLYVTFTPAIRRVAFVAGAHGSLDGSTTQLITEGGSSSGVTATAGSGYHFVNWVRTSGSGGSFVAAANPVVVTGVGGNTTLTANFAINTYRIVPTAGPGGSISPATTQTVNYGSSSTSFTISPLAGYRIADVVVDGSSQGALPSYKFTNVASNAWIAATFEPEPTPTHTWTGAQLDHKFSSAHNWSGNTTPSAGDDLVFPADAADYDPDNDLLTSVGNVAMTGPIAGPGYECTGSPIMVTGGITDTSGAYDNAWSIDTTFSGTQTVVSNAEFFRLGNFAIEPADGSSDPAELTLNAARTVPAGSIWAQGRISGPGSLKILTSGAYEVQFTGQNNSWSGTTTVGTDDETGTVRIVNRALSPNSPIHIGGMGQLIAYEHELDDWVEWPNSVSAEATTAQLAVDADLRLTHDSHDSFAGSTLISSGNRIEVASGAGLGGTIHLSQDGDLGHMGIFQGDGRLGTVKSGTGDTNLALWTGGSAPLHTQGGKPGTITADALSLSSPAYYMIAMSDAGAPGTGDGAIRSFTHVTGAVRLDAALTAYLVTVPISDEPTTPGPMADFQGDEPYSWTVLHADGGITTGAGYESTVTLMGFANPYPAGSKFTLRISDGKDLVVDYAPDPVIRTWIGADGENFDDAANWDPAGVPHTGDSLIFPVRSAPYEAIDDIPDLTVNRISVNTSSPAVGGDAVTVSGPSSHIRANEIVVPTASDVARLRWLVPTTMGSSDTIAVGENRSLYLPDVILDADVAVETSETGFVDFSGVVSGSHALNMSGSGSVTLNSHNTYTGGTSVHGTYVSLSDDHSLGSGDATVAAGGTIHPANGLTVPNALHIAGAGHSVWEGGYAGAIYAAKLFDPSASYAVTMSGPIDVMADAHVRTSTGGRLAMTGAAVFQAAGAMLDVESDGAAFLGSLDNGAYTGCYVFKRGAGSLAFTESNMLEDWAVTIAQGKLVNGVDCSLPWGSNVTFGWPGTAGTLDVASHDLDIRGLRTGGGATAADQRIENSGGGPCQLQLAQDYSRFDGVISGDGLSLKIAPPPVGGLAPQLELNGANTYTGETRVGAEGMGGNLTASSAGAIPSGSTLRLEGGGQFIAAPSGSGTISLDNPVHATSGTQLSVTSGLLRINGDSSSTFQGFVAVEAPGILQLNGARLGGRAYVAGSAVGHGQLPGLELAGLTGTLAPCDPQQQPDRIYVGGDTKWTRGTVRTKVHAATTSVEATGWSDVSMSGALTVPGSLVRTIVLETTGTVAGFDKTRSYRWPVIHTGAPIPEGALGKITLDTTLFTDQNPIDGTFTLAIGEGGTSIDVVYSGSGDRVLAGFKNGLAFGSGYLNVPASAGIAASPSSNITYEMWLKKDSGTSDHQTLFCQQPADFSDALQTWLYINADGHAYVGYQQRGPDNPQWGWAGGPVIPTDKWVHLAMVRQGTLTTFYVDGQQAWTGPTNNPEWSVSGPAVNVPLRVGQQILDGNTFKGTLDEIMIYDSALTAAEIASQYNRGRGQGLPIGKEPVRYYQLDESEGTSASDSGSDGLAATLTDMAVSPWVESTASRVYTTTRGVSAPMALGYGDGAVTTVTVAIDTQPANGTIVLTDPEHGKGSFVPYAHGPSGGAFTYTVSNGVASSTATGTVTVTGASTYQVAYLTDGTSGSSVSSSTQTVQEGSDAAPVTATAPTGYHFTHWTGTGSLDTTTSNPVTVPNVSADQTLTAHFAVDPGAHRVVVQHGAGGSLEGTSPQTIVDGGSSTPVTATPDSGYHFVKWSLEDSSTQSTSNPLVATNVSANATWTAEFSNVWRFRNPTPLISTLWSAGGNWDVGTKPPDSPNTVIVVGEVSKLGAGINNAVSDVGTLTAEYWYAYEGTQPLTVWRAFEVHDSMSVNGDLKTAGATGQTMDIGGYGNQWGDLLLNNSLPDFHAKTTVHNQGRLQVGPYDGGVGIDLPADVTLETGSAMIARNSSVSTLTVGGWLMLTDWSGEVFSLDVTSGPISLEPSGTIIMRIKSASPDPGTGQSVLRGGPAGVDIDSTAGSPLRIAIYGPPSGFDKLRSYTWKAVVASSTTGFDAAKFTVDSTSFGAATAGGFTVTEQPAGTINVVYTPEVHTIHFVSGGHGSVVGSLTQTIDYGGSATPVTATADDHSTFENWTGTGGFVTTTSNPVTLTNVTSDMTITANFTPDTHTVHFVTDGTAGSSVSSGTVVVADGASAGPVTATAPYGYRFANWTGTNGFVTTTSNPVTVANVTADMTVTAHFALAPPPPPVTHTVLFVTDGTPGASVTTSVTVVDDGAPAGPVTAVTPTGYHFTQWTGTSGFATTTANPITVAAVYSDMTLTAHYARNSYTVTATAGAGGSIAPSGASSYLYGDTATYTVTAAAGFRVGTVTVDGTPATLTAGAYVFRDISADRTIAVTFGPTTHTVRFATDGSPGATVSRSTVVVADGGSAGPVTASPGIGYSFVNWTGSGLATSTANPVTVTNVTADMTVTAHFGATPLLPVTTISALPSAWGTRDVTFTLSATGTAPIDTYYGLNAAATTAYTGQVTVSQQGTTTVAYRSSNIAGAEATKTAQVRIDKTAPETTSNVKPTYAGPATITLSATDAYSGVAHTYYSLNGEPYETYTAPVTVTIAGPDTIDFYSVDVAGNREATRTASFTVTAEQTDVGGATRYATNVAASRSAFATDSVETVVVATGANFPDALAAAPLAGAYRAPVLLTQAASVPADTLAEIERLGATRAVIVGGTGVITPAAASQIAAVVGGSGHVSRVGGTDRYATAAAVAARIREVHPTLDGTVFLATGTDYPDALSAGADAWARVRPILLTKGAYVPPATLSAVSALRATRVAVLGGTGVVPDSAVTAVKTRMLAPKSSVRLGEADRYGTAVAVAKWASTGEGLDWVTCGMATGEIYPDALGAGPALGARGSTLLLTDPDALPDVVAAALSEYKADVIDVTFFGGDGAISPAVREQVMNELK